MVHLPLCIRNPERWLNPGVLAQARAHFLQIACRGHRVLGVAEEISVLNNLTQPTYNFWVLEAVIHAPFPPPQHQHPNPYFSCTPPLPPDASASQL